MDPDTFPNLDHDASPDDPGAIFHPSVIGEPTAEFIHVSTPNLVVIEDLEGVTNMDVEGRFVKLAPKIPASQRDAFDGPAFADQLREAGALAVILAPVFLTETKKVDEVAEARNDRDALRAWFEAQKVADPTDLEAAENLVLGFMDQEGM